MKLYLTTQNGYEIISPDPKGTLVYDNGKGLLEGEWIEISLKQFIKKIKHPYRKIYTTKKTLNPNQITNGKNKSTKVELQG